MWQRVLDSKHTPWRRQLGQGIYIAMLATACGCLAVAIGLCGYQYYKFYRALPGMPAASAPATPREKPAATKGGAVEKDGKADDKTEKAKPEKAAETK